MLPRHSIARPSPVESTLGLAALVIGSISFLGWVLDIGWLKGGLGNGLTMKANTALCFVAVGLAIAPSSDRSDSPHRYLVTALAVVVALIAGLSLGEELFSLDFGIDGLFADIVSAPVLARPGRMSPSTATCFLALAVSLASSAMPDRVRLQLPLAAALGAAVTLIGGMILAANVSSRVFGLRWGTAATMAVSTSLTFVLTGVAAFLRARRLQSFPWALGNASTAGFILGVVMMLCATEFATIYARDMEQSNLRVIATERGMEALQEIRADLRALEGSQRGQLILGGDAFVAARESRKSAVRQHLGALASMPAADAPPAAALQALQQAIAARVAFGDHLIDLRRREGFEAARGAFAGGTDVALTRAITDLIEPLARRQGLELRERQKHSREVTATTFLLLPIDSSLGLIALLSGLFFLDDGLGRRRRAERVLEQGHAELQVVFDSMAEGIRVIDEAGTLVRTNPSGATAHGLAEDVSTVRTVTDQVEASLPGGGVLDVHEWPAMRALRGDFVRNLEVHFRSRRTGRRLAIEITTAPLPTEPGEPRRVLLTSHDVTERRTAEAAAREGQDRLQRVVESLPAGVLIHGLDGERIHWNRAALEMYGMSSDDVADLDVDDLQRMFELSTLDGRLVPHPEWPMLRLLSESVLRRVELRLRRRDRAWERVFAYEGASVRDRGGQSLVFLTVTDVTARSVAESALLRLNAELEGRVGQRTAELDAKTRELESFCYSVSHDLKAPLRGIDGYSRLLSEEYDHKLDDDGRSFIRNVRTATSQMNALIDDLLAYSREERRTMAPTPVALRAFVADKATLDAADRERVVLDIDVHDVSVHADRDGLSMALRNLVDNAVKFSARAASPRVAIRSSLRNGKCVLSVQDNGAGFDMRYHDKIFEIFQRLHRAEDYPGTGVGLALVRKAMERMGGLAWADSRPGEGATFHLELDLA